MPVEYVQEWRFICDGAYCWSGKEKVRHRPEDGSPAVDPPLPAGWMAVDASDPVGKRVLCPGCSKQLVSVFRDIHLVEEAGYADHRTGSGADSDDVPF